MIKWAATNFVLAAAVKNTKNATACKSWREPQFMLSWIRNFFLTALSAALLAIPFHFDNLGLIAFFAFIPYFFVLDSRSLSGTFRYSYLFGFFFFCFLGYWLTHVNILAFLLLAAYLALYFAFFGLW